MIYVGRRYDLWHITEKARICGGYFRFQFSNLNIIWMCITINQQDAAVNSQIYCTAGLLYMFRVLSTPIIRSTPDCIYSLRYMSYYRCSYLLPTWLSLNSATLEEGSCNDNMTCTGGCRYSLVYYWWWVWKAPETCRVTLQYNKFDC